MLDELAKQDGKIKRLAILLQRLLIEVHGRKLSVDEWRHKWVTAGELLEHNPLAGLKKIEELWKVRPYTLRMTQDIVRVNKLASQARRRMQSK